MVKNTFADSTTICIKNDITRWKPTQLHHIIHYLYTILRRLILGEKNFEWVGCSCELQWNVMPYMKLSNKLLYAGNSNKLPPLRVVFTLQSSPLVWFSPNWPAVKNRVSVLVFIYVLKHHKLHFYTQLVKTCLDSCWYLNFLMNLAVVV